MTSDDTPEPATPGRRRAPLLIGVAAGVVVLIAIAAAVWAASSPRGSGPTSSSAAGASSTPAASSPAPKVAVSTPVPTPDPAKVPDPSLNYSTEIPVKFQDAQPVTQNLVIRVSSVEAVQGTASQPGDIAGPSLKFVVEFANSSSQPISLRDVAVNADFGPDRTPALELHDGATPVPGEVGPNSVVSGTYIFNVPESGRDNVRLIVFTTVDHPVIAFSGPTPR